MTSSPRDVYGDKKKRAPRKPRVDGRSAPHTREAILDAAEAAFVEGGYHGASLRKISSAAGVQQALSYYHFGSKEDLFRAVIHRRADDNVAGLRASLEAALAVKGTRQVKLEALIRAFLQPVVERATRHGPGWRNYIRLLAQVGNLPQDEQFIVPFSEHYDAVVRDYIAALGRLLPGMDAADVNWGFSFLQAVLSNMIIETRMVDRQSDGLCRSADLETIVDKATRFFTAAFRGFQP